MKYIEPHAHMVSRTTDDYERMALAGCTAVCEPAFWAGFDRSSIDGFHDYCFLRKLHILGPLGIDAEPEEMFQAELGGAFWLVLGELAEIIVEAVYGTAVEARPERRLANRLATGERHAFVVIR